MKRSETRCGGRILVQVKVNTPRVQSDEALAHIMQILHYMERIGRLQHGVMLPFGADATKIKEGDQLWQPWSSEERKYIRDVRTIFAHARYSVLPNGSLRVRDRYRLAPGKPDIQGFLFDKTTTDWEWSPQELQEFSEKLRTLVLERIQGYSVATVTCQTCGQTVKGQDRLACGHVKYPEGSTGSFISKPAGGTLQITFAMGYQDDMKDKYGGEGRKGVITYDGLDLIINSLEAMDKIAIEGEKKGTPIYVGKPDSLNAHTPSG